MVSTPTLRPFDPGHPPGESQPDNQPVARVKGGRSWWLHLAPLALLGVLLSWAVTSPVGSSPDDDYHLSSIWCAGGERSGACEIDPDDAGVLLVPESVGFAHECFAFDAEVTANCSEGLSANVVPTDRVNNVQGVYPGGFYRVMGLLVGPDEVRSVLAMRVLNALIAVVLLALALRVLTPGIRSALLVVVVVLYIPVGLFIIPSTNPSSWTLTGITYLWAFALALAHRRNWRSRRTWVLAAATIVSAALAIGSRVDAAAYVSLVIAVVLLLTGYQRIRRAWITAAVLVVIAAFGFVQFATFGTPGSGEIGGMGGTQPGAGLLLTNIVFLPVYLSGAVGGMAIGWNDTPLPPMVFVFGVLVLGALAYRGLQQLSARKSTASVVALAAVVAVPLLFLQLEGLGVGEVVQARYLLPLMVLLFATLSLPVTYAKPSAPGLPLPRAAAWTIGVAMAATASISLWVNAHRYAAGSTRGLFDLDLQMDWTGLLPIPLPVVVALGVVASIAYVAAAVVSVHRDAVRPQLPRLGG